MTAVEIWEFERELGKILDNAHGYAVRLCRGNRERAEDLLQEATIAAFKGLATFDRGTNFKAWFFKILTNAFYRISQRKEVDTVVVEEGLDAYLYIHAKGSGIDVSGDPAQLLLNKIDSAEIGRALDDLPSEFREVSILYFSADMSYDEIAETLEVPVGTVRSRLHRARKLLQVQLWELASSRGVVEGSHA
jgi:RNA polymerase sigma-70 factor (ECF subfamily)